MVFLSAREAQQAFNRLRHIHQYFAKKEAEIGTYTERTPNAQFAFLTNGSRYAVTGSNTGRSESLVYQGLEWEGLRSEGVDVQEFPFFLRIGNIRGDTTESSIVICTTRPYLREQSVFALVLS